MARGGSLTSKDAEIRHQGRTIEGEIRIDAPAEVVWQAWADPARVPAWFVDRAEGRMEVGSTVQWFWDSTDEGMTHRVLAAEEIQLPLVGS